MAFIRQCFPWPAPQTEVPKGRSIPFSKISRYLSHGRAWTQVCGPVYMGVPPGEIGGNYATMINISQWKKI